jgi:small subunit ribosomal protein S8
MVTDPIADLLVRLKNASRASHATTDIPYSRLKEQILEIMLQGGLVGGVAKRGRKTNRRLEVALRYDEEKNAALHDARRLSRPGRRMYVKAKELTGPKYGRGLLILSTPQGLMTHREAKAKKLGGETLLEIW